MQKAVANGGQLTHASLFKVLRTQETSFNADGITGTTNVSSHAQAGTFDCKPANLITVKQSV